MFQKSDGSCACGFYLEKGLSWRAAADRCYAQGARLPEIYSAADNDAILKIRVMQIVKVRIGLVREINLLIW